MINNIKQYLKQKLAKDELQELWVLKQRISEVGVWCSSDPKAVAVSKYLQDIHSYPCQSRGAHGSIEDFREYLKTLN